MISAFLPFHKIALISNFRKKDLILGVRDQEPVKSRVEKLQKLREIFQLLQEIKLRLRKERHMSWDSNLLPPFNVNMGGKERDVSIN